MDHNDDDEEEEVLSPEELALFSEPRGPAAGTADRPEEGASRAAAMAERSRLKSQGLLVHNGEEIAVLAVGDSWKAFLLNDPRGSVGTGEMPGAALADLKRKLDAPVD